MTTRSLSHVRVLDFGHYLAGPLVGMMLADLGAEVIRIDPPGGPRWSDPAFDMLSRGKWSLVLDLKTDEGRRTALEMATRADVVIDNFRPGVMARLGLGPADLRAVNPGIISLSLPGFASTDPELAPVAAWEAVIAARTGQFTDMGLNRQLMGIIHPSHRWGLHPPTAPPSGQCRFFSHSVRAIGWAVNISRSRSPRRCSRGWLTTASTSRTIPRATSLPAKWNLIAAAPRTCR